MAPGRLGLQTSDRLKRNISGPIVQIRDLVQFLYGEKEPGLEVILFLGGGRRNVSGLYRLLINGWR
jgi:hypothetical protein